MGQIIGTQDCNSILKLTIIALANSSASLSWMELKAEKKVITAEHSLSKLPFSSIPNFDHGRGNEANEAVHNLWNTSRIFQA